jgi:two-component system, NtrC family, sensor kinase
MAIELADRVAATAAATAVAPVAAGLAHEINNALSVVLANVEEAAHIAGEPPRAQGEDLRTMLEEALAAAQRIQSAIRDLRVFASPDDGRRPVDLNAVASSCCNIAIAWIRHRARLVRNLQATRMIRGHEGQLAHVVMSMLANAAQAMRDGNIEANEIEVATRDEDGKVVLEVRDTGCGIAPETEARVFEPFFTTKPGRSGIGLCVVRGIVAEHDGEVTIRSDAGAGTCVRVACPAV